MTDHQIFSQKSSFQDASPAWCSLSLRSTPAHTNWMCIVVCVLFSSISLQVMTRQAFADQPTETEIVASPVTGSIWFDDDAGELIPVEVSDQQTDTDNRDSRWTGVSRNKAKPAPAAPAAGANGGFTIARLIGWLMLAGLLVGIVSLLAWVFANSDFDFTPGNVEQSLLTGEQLDRQTRQRMEHLPEALRDTSVNPRAQAERLMESGQYNEAVIYLYGHQLLLLDRVHWLRLARGKTNSRYVRETKRSQPDAGNQLQQTVSAFERAYFGRHEISKDEFQRLWQTNAVLEQEIQAADSVRKPGAA
ncbi:hypothetical protein RBSH_05482 [Rhodopirellula baltica SH28]|uniref:Protein-glutamine gamma-glutamyltransferase-like C-terminal domain-containing protein n=1 Tax=Rhodopirellula baltica SH28 TaxID=993517 RepID=K5C875_RHOBT|nr:DUF4129 domain-containing protein [Rhodopirellula baltica]EKJ99174.1 hypothetical protein RBSH_05482 [Rhodopirellula baltica SH28]